MAKRKKARVPTAPAPRSQPQPLLTRNRIVAAVGIAALIAIALVAASLLSSRGDDDSGGAEVAGASDVQALLDGIPQDGVVLGKADAPVTLVEYADLQCPFCAEWSRSTFPVLVADYVRDGQLKIEFRGLTFIGPDSEEALRAALGAGGQDSLWNVVDLLYTNQGTENSGWVTESFLRSIGGAVAGLDVDQMLDDADADSVTERIAQDANAANASGVTATPSFEIGKTGSPTAPLEFDSLGPADFRAAIDQLLNG